MWSHASYIYVTAVDIKRSKRHKHTLVFWAKQKPSVRLAIYEALLDRLAVLNWH